MKILEHVKSFYIVKKLNDDSDYVVQTTTAVADYLTCIGLKQKYLMGQITPETLVVSVGGDGTMLHAARIAAQNGAYVIGFNLGKLGFITADFVNHSVDETLCAFINNDIFIQERLLLTLNESVAVNEFLFQPRGAGMPLQSFTLLDRGHLVTQYDASGVVISTPTGSTAFAVSLGGSIIEPTVRAIQVLPLAAHSLMQGAHPIIMPDTAEIEIQTDRSKVDVIADGRPVTSAGDKLIVKVSSKAAKFVHSEGWNFFDVLTKKLGWK